MRVAYADTFYFLALAIKSDASHRSAHALLTSYAGRVVTSDWVLVEIADALCRQRHRPLVRQLVFALRSNPGVTIVNASDDDLAAAWSLYFSRDDKEWSLTDCISFTIMDRLGIHDAITGDQHFAQAGFNVLLPRSAP